MSQHQAFDLSAVVENAARALSASPSRATFATSDTIAPRVEGPANRAGRFASTSAIDGLQFASTTVSGLPQFTPNTLTLRPAARDL